MWIANLSWISVLQLTASLVLMTTQLAKAKGGHLPQHAPKSLLPGVFGLSLWFRIACGCSWSVGKRLRFAGKALICRLETRVGSQTAFARICYAGAT